MPADEYNDAYQTCVETYSTLCIFSSSETPDAISALLGVTPTRSFKIGDVHGVGQLRRKTNGWFYSTQNLSESKDSRRHIDLLLSAIEGKSQQLAELRGSGCTMSISTYWVSQGHGGPSLWPRQMLALGYAGIEAWWDVYFKADDET